MRLGLHHSLPRAIVTSLQTRRSPLSSEARKVPCASGHGGMFGKPPDDKKSRIVVLKHVESELERDSMVRRA